MTEGSATPIVVKAILAATPGTYGMIASAAPPSATQAPAKIPRATRLDTPRASRRCEPQPAAMTRTTLAPAGSAPNRPIAPCVKPSPLIKKAPCHDRACDNPHWAPKAAHQLAMIVGLNNNCRYAILWGFGAASVAVAAVNEPSRPSNSHATTQASPAKPSTPKAQCQEYFTMIQLSSGSATMIPMPAPCAMIAVGSVRNSLGNHL